MAVKVALGNGQEDGWIQSFSRVERLRSDFTWAAFNTISLFPFRNISASFMSLCIVSFSLPLPHVFNLIRFLPLLEGLTFTGYDVSVTNSDEPDGLPTVVPSASPPLTGSLEFLQCRGMADTMHRLLDLPKGLHFRKLNLP